jgi:hypothetical protein
MSTVMRHHAVIPVREPVSHLPKPTSTRAPLAEWVTTHPGLTSIALSAIYVATLVALVGVLASATLLTTPFGVGIGALFVAEVLGFVAIAVYVVVPAPDGAFGAE